MNAMEKVAWTELVVSLAAVALVSLLFPWLGSRAAGGFAILGLIVLSVVFTRRRNQRVVIDERDREIESRARRIGVETSWMTLLIVLAATTLWSNYRDQHAVSTAILNWLIWTQLAMYFGVKGLAAVIAYRRQPHAS